MKSTVIKLIAVTMCWQAPYLLAAQTTDVRDQINLSAGDTMAFKQAPPGFDKARKNIHHGKIDSVFYDSKNVGKKRRMIVYTPPGYSNQKKYPVLYLLHGIGGDEKEWFDQGSPQVILDNLYGDKRLAPMIIIMPNGRAMTDDSPGANIFAPDKVKAFSAFELDLLKDLIPFVEKNYPVLSGKENRALAGLSMGGGQSLNFGLGHLDVFDWIGGFSPAPNTKKPEELIPDVTAAKKIRLLWISCGDKDNLIGISQGLHRFLEKNNISHVWNPEPGKHDFDVWKNDLYLFSQLIFR